MPSDLDSRAPAPESGQYYQVPKLWKVECALVRVPGAGHDITARPGHLIAEVSDVPSWFGKPGAKP